LGQALSVPAAGRLGPQVNDSIVAARCQRIAGGAEGQGIEDKVLVGGKQGSCGSLFTPACGWFIPNKNPTRIGGLFWEVKVAASEFPAAAMRQ
jgi:hypothetical protein